MNKRSAMFYAIAEVIDVIENNASNLPVGMHDDLMKVIDSYIGDMFRREARASGSKNNRVERKESENNENTKKKSSKLYIKEEIINKLGRLPKSALTEKQIKKALGIRKQTFEKLLQLGYISEAGNGLYVVKWEGS